MMTSARVVETLVTITDNSPFQDYPHPDDQITLSHVTPPGFQAFPVIDIFLFFSILKILRQFMWFYSCYYFSAQLIRRVTCQVNYAPISAAHKTVSISEIALVRCLKRRFKTENGRERKLSQKLTWAGLKSLRRKAPSSLRALTAPHAILILGPLSALHAPCYLYASP